MAKKYDFGDGKVHGVDFEMVPSGTTKDSKGNPVLTRRFFTKAEKAALKAPKAEAPAKKSTAAAVATAKPKEKPVTKDAMKGYRAGDITTSKLGAGGRGDGSAERIRRTADAALSKAPKKASTGGPARMPVAKPVKKETTFADWKKMTRAERKAKGLPTSEIGGQLAFKRFMTGITGKEYTK
jgi:hypothetical protein